MSVFDVMYPSGRKKMGNMKVMSQETSEDIEKSPMETMAIYLGNEYTVIPTVSPDGRKLTTEEAMMMYKETNAHFGIFYSPEEAESFSKAFNEAHSRPTGHEIELGQDFDGSF